VSYISIPLLTDKPPLRLCVDFRYFARFASQLELPCEVETEARALAEESHELGLTSGRNPSGIAAACLYTAATERDHPLTQQAAADVAGVTPVTLRATYYDLRE
jgi:transcription initiation factor TFIIB